MYNINGMTVSLKHKRIDDKVPRFKFANNVQITYPPIFNIADLHAGQSH